MIVADAIDTKRNPFYRNATLEMWVAREHGRSVGRVAAIHNEAHNRRFDDDVGFFGFFESVDSQAVADRLLDTAADWLAERGLTTVRGPASPSMNHECGLLVESFDRPTRVMTPWNPDYYPSLLSGWGLSGVKDTLAFWIPTDQGFDPIAPHERIVERIRRQGRVRVRAVDYSELGTEMETLRSLYNESWEDAWGFLPLSRAEWDHMSPLIRLVTPRSLQLIAEVDGEPAGFLLALPDLNQIFRKHPSGRLSPLLLWRLFRSRWTVTAMRVVLLGIRAEHRRTGLVSLLVQELVERGGEVDKAGAEGSWILEDNLPLRSILERLSPPVRRWRFYEAPVR